MRAKSFDRMLGPVRLALLVGALAAGFSTASRAAEPITEEAATSTPSIPSSGWI